MSKRNKQIATSSLSPFNSALESGLRAMCILYEGYPAGMDSQRLVFFDYLVVHSGDVKDGPESLHPATPFRSNEWLLRRQLVDQGLRLLTQRGLAAPSLTEYGILYSATDAAGAFMACLSQDYTQVLKQRASWVIENFGDTDETELIDYFNTHLDRWGAEFQPVGDWGEDT